MNYDGVMVCGMEIEVSTQKILIGMIWTFLLLSSVVLTFIRRWHAFFAAYFCNHIWEIFKYYECRQPLISVVYDFLNPLFY